MTNPSHPVVVVGAGPVGLSTALALRAQELPVTVLEAAAPDRRRAGSRAIFLHRESLEHLETIRPGLGRALARNGLVTTTKRTYWGEDLVYERTYPPPPAGRLPHATNLSQVDIEAILLEACTAAGVEIAWEQQVDAVEAAPDGVVIRTTPPDATDAPARSGSSGSPGDPDGTGAAATTGSATTGAGAGDEWRAAYVVGADGARSAVRSAIGSALEGPRVDSSFVIVDVAEDPERPQLPERVYYYRHPAVGGRNVLLVPFAGGIRADLQLRPDDDPADFDDPEGVRRWIARVLPERYAERVTWVSTYRFHQAVASAFTGEHRRALLVGEAAHLFAPFGARGLNSGIPDGLVAARAIRQALDDPGAADAAVDHFATTRRDAALYNRDAAGLALRHMQAGGWRIRLKRRLNAAVAKRGLGAGAWLDSSPFGPRAAAHKTETGSY